MKYKRAIVDPKLMDILAEVQETRRLNERKGNEILYNYLMLTLLAVESDNYDKPENIPDTLKEVPELKRYLNIILPVIYFLVHEDAVVYVGRTSRSIFTRLKDHIKSEIEFDEVYYINVEKQTAAKTEAYYIKKYKPIHNTHLIMQ